MRRYARPSVRVIANVRPQNQGNTVFPAYIETGRLRLRQPIASDAEPIFHAYAQDPQVTRYLVWKPHVNIATTRTFIAQCQSRWTEGSGFPYAITLKTRNDPIGMIDLRPKDHRVDFGYVLARAYWGNGFMPEAIVSIVSVSLAIAAVYRVEATCDVENRASARAMEKAGLSREGVLRRYMVHPNISSEPRDSLLYAITK
jgi:[ribosomal protein S5]-alanine N-acetyltransferase